MLKVMTVFQLFLSVQLASFSVYASNSELEGHDHFSPIRKSATQSSVSSQIHKPNNLNQAHLENSTLASDEGEDSWALHDKADELYEQRDFQGAAAAYLEFALKGNAEALDYLVTIDSSVKEYIAKGSDLTRLQKQLSERFNHDYQEREKGTVPLNLPRKKCEFEFKKFSF